MDAALLQRQALGRLIVLAAALIAAAPVHAADCPPLLDAAVPTLSDDKPESMCQYRGKVILVVNTASQCGYTPQYEGLEKLYRRYKDRGLVVLGFPSNDFGAQEPGSNKEIAKFCEANYGVSFPMFTKTSVAKSPNPFYQKLSKATGKSPAWNFHKYLVDRSGTKAQSFVSDVEPDDRKFVAEIERLLSTKEEKK